MPRLEEALFDYLSADDGIAALVDDRIYPVRLPEGAALPAITFQRISANRIYTYDTFAETDAWVSARVQFDCWAADVPKGSDPYPANTAMNVGEAVLLALSGYDGDMAGELVVSSMATNEIDIYEVPTKFHRRILDFQISYEDDLPDAS